MRHLLFVAVVFLAAACGAHGPQRTGGRVVLLPEEAPSDPFVIQRPDLEAVLARGPSWVVQQVPVQPVVVDGRFYGFRIRALFPDDPGFREGAIRAGDIVQQVNGVSIETPSGYMRAWESLATARHLTVRIVRAGRPLLITWAIAGAAAEPRAATSSGP